MNEEEIKRIITLNYNLDIKSIEKVKNTYKVNAKEEMYCVKVIKYQFPHFYFILSAILHLQQRGFDKIPTILKTKGDEYYIELLGRFAYLTEWIPSRESNYDNPIELDLVAQKLGELHESSKGFTITDSMKPRIGWFSWLKVFDTRKDEMLDFKHRISQKAHKSDFDKIYLENIENEVNRAEKSVSELSKLNYYELMEKEMFKRGFCHHDYANHNVLIDNKGEINIIDFDYCILDTHIHDLSSLLIRAMKNGKWDKNKAERIINNYCKTSGLIKEELPLMKEFIRFPQGFWQLGIQMYWEQQPWEERFFIERLQKYLNDREEREQFVESFFS